MAIENISLVIKEFSKVFNINFIKLDEQNYTIEGNEGICFVEKYADLIDSASKNFNECNALFKKYRDMVDMQTDKFIFKLLTFAELILYFAQYLRIHGGTTQTFLAESKTDNSIERFMILSNLFCLMIDSYTEDYDCYIKSSVYALYKHITGGNINNNISDVCCMLSNYLARPDIDSEQNTFIIRSMISEWDSLIPVNHLLNGVSIHEDIEVLEKSYIQAKEEYINYLNAKARAKDPYIYNSFINLAKLFNIEFNTALDWRELKIIPQKGNTFISQHEKSIDCASYNYDECCKAFEKAVDDIEDIFGYESDDFYKYFNILSDFSMILYYAKYIKEHGGMALQLASSDDDIVFRTKAAILYWNNNLVPDNIEEAYLIILCRIQLEIKREQNRILEQGSSEAYQYMSFVCLSKFYQIIEKCFRNEPVPIDFLKIVLKIAEQVDINDYDAIMGYLNENTSVKNKIYNYMG